MNSSDTRDTLTVMLVDDHAIVREGYKRLLETHGRIAVIGEADSGEVALSELRRVNPDVVVMDVSLPGESGITTLRRMRQQRRSLRALMFSMHEDPIFAERSLQAGALGYVTKASAPHVLVEAVRAVAARRMYLSHELSQELALRGAVDGSGANTLSARELEVLRFLIEGLAVRHIAERLNLSSKTVANLQSTIRTKLGADTPVQFVNIGARLLRALADPRQ